jgi:hypothetical protein
MASVGGSMGWAGIGVSTLGSAMVSATLAIDSPAMATMSPASAVSTGSRSRPRKPRILVMRPCSISLPSRDSALTCWLTLKVPERMRPVSSRPR